WFQCYFEIKEKSGLLPLPPICHLINRKDSFTFKVWKTLVNKVPIKETVTYGELAVLSGSSKRASIAVGQAMRMNPVMILVPCHRVVPSTGGIGNYAGGKKNDIKAWLLKHEGKFL
ncbi:hypothetical protein CAPTEDRAFT_112476, partial [Capitella teleta]